MPRVPVAENRVGIASVSDAKLVPAEYDSGGLGRGLQEVGQGLNQLAKGVEIHQVHYDEAAVKTLDNQAVLALRDIRTGVFSKQGLDAVGAATAASDQLKSLRASTIAAAANKRQREMIGDLFDRRAASDLDSITNYSNGETAKANQLASGARADIARDEAVSNYTDPVKFDDNISVGLTETANLWKPYGESVVKEKQRAFVSGVRSGVVESLRKSDPIGAAAYIEDHKGDFSPADLTKLKDVLYEPLLERQAASDVDGLMSVGAAPNGAVVAPKPPAPTPGTGTTASRMVAITAMTESRGRDRDSKGNIVTSPKGAQGRMQVMPGTNSDPGFGVRPAADNSDEERARVGRDYLAAMMKRYGNDPAKAWAAYNGGPGRVDDAVKKGGANWLGYMPKESRDYVATNVAALGGKPGQPTYAPRRDDLAGLYAQVDAQPWSFDRKEAARREIDQRVSRDDALRNRQESDAERSAYDYIDKNGGFDKFTSLSQLPADIVRDLSPQSRVRFREQAAANAAPKAVEADGPTAISLNDLAVLNRDAFVKTDLRAFQSQMRPDEYARLHTLQTKMIAEPQKTTTQDQVWGTITRRGADVGIDMGAKRSNEGDDAFKKRREAGWSVVKMMQKQLDWVTEGKRAPTEQELNVAFDQAVMMGANGVPRYMDTKLTPGGSVGVPTAEAEIIRNQLKAMGQPTDQATIARIYFTRQAKKY